MTAGAAARAGLRAIFLPGFDGAAALRGPFVAALGRRLPCEALGYPGRPLGDLDGYRREAAARVPGDAPLALVAESFSGLVAARWASRDARVRALVLCGAFARNPVGPLAALGAAAPRLVAWAARLPLRWPPAPGPGPHARWARGFREALDALDPAVLAERLRIIAAADVRAELGALAVPVVLVQFARDRVVRARARRELEAVCHNARVVRFPGPHFALEVEPVACAEAIARALDAALEDHERRKGGT